MTSDLQGMTCSELRAAVLDTQYLKTIGALVLAEFVHKGQTRPTLRDGVLVEDPYIVHPMRNCLRAREAGLDVIDQIISLLHDTVEDGPERIQEFFQSDDDPVKLLRENFSEYVSGPVSRLSLPRKKTRPYHLQVWENIRDDPRAKRGKTLDVRDNAGELKNTTPGPRRLRRAEKYLPLAILLHDDAENDYLRDLMVETVQVCEDIIELGQ